MVKARCLAEYLGDLDAQQRLLLPKRSEGEVSVQEGPGVWGKGADTGMRRHWKTG